MEYFAHNGGDVGYNMMGGWGDSASYGLWGWLCMLAVIALVVIGIILLVKLMGGRALDTKKDEPIDMLKRRYAKGEINKQQFDEAKKDISAK